MHLFADAPALRVRGTSPRPTPVAAPNLTAAEVVRVVAREYGVSTEQILGRSRVGTIVEARHVVMWALREVLGYSYPKIGRSLSRDHSTALVGCREIHERVAVDAELRAHVQAVRAVLDGVDEPVCLSCAVRERRLADVIEQIETLAQTVRAIGRAS